MVRERIDKFVVGVFDREGNRRLCEDSPQSISELTQSSNLTRHAISKRLRVLEGVGLVSSVRAGREILYEFRPRPIEGVKTYLDRVSRQWDDALGRLKLLVER